MKNKIKYGSVKCPIIMRPKSDLQQPRSNDQVKFFDITRQEIEMHGENIIPATCPNCNSENCVREYHPVGFERILCLTCAYELTFWCTRDKNLQAILIDKSISITLEYLTSKEFIIKNPFGIYIMELFVGGTCGAALESDLTLSPSQDQDQNIKNLTVFKVKDNEVVKKIVFQTLHHLSSSASLPIAIC